MPTHQDHTIKCLDRSQVVDPADVRCLKGRLQAPAAPVSVENMARAIRDSRTHIALATSRKWMRVR